jgi:hypothetical protein
VTAQLLGEQTRDKRKIEIAPLIPSWLLHSNDVVSFAGRLRLLVGGGALAISYGQDC